MEGGGLTVDEFQSHTPSTPPVTSKKGTEEIPMRLIAQSADGQVSPYLPCFLLVCARTLVQKNPRDKNQLSLFAKPNRDATD
jgi:hypothetical protein